MQFRNFEKLLLMKTLLILFLLIPSFGWGKDVYLECECTKMDSKYSDSRVFMDLVGCFNYQFPKKQSIIIRYTNDEPSELIFSLHPFIEYKDFKNIDDTNIKFGYLSFNEPFKDGKFFFQKKTLTINRTTLDAQYKHVMNNRVFSVEEIQSFKVDASKWDEFFFDEEYRDFVSIDYMNCKIVEKKI